MPGDINVLDEQAAQAHLARLRAFLGGSLGGSRAVDHTGAGAIVGIAAGVGAGAGEGAGSLPPRPPRSASFSTFFACAAEPNFK